MDRGYGHSIPAPITMVRGQPLSHVVPSQSQVTREAGKEYTVIHPTCHMLHWDWIHTAVSHMRPKHLWKRKAVV